MSKSAVDNEKREIEGYIELHTIPVGRKEIMLLENQEKENPYLVCYCSWNNPFNADEYSYGQVFSDYAEAMVDFIGRIEIQVQKVVDERNVHNLPNQVLGKEHCVQTSHAESNYVGKLLIVKPEKIAREYRRAETQLIIANHGNGCDPNSRGQAIFFDNLLTNEKGRWERHNILGIADLDKIPDWAKKKLEERQKACEKPSVLSALEENKKAVATKAEKREVKPNDRSI